MFPLIRRKRSFNRKEIKKISKFFKSYFNNKICSRVKHIDLI